MPSSITHELIAREAEKLLPEPLRRMIDAAPDYYLLGAQGPDLFFFYKPLSKREYNLGKTLHRGKLYEWFCALLDGLKDRTGTELDRCRAYALGFCSHLEADSAFHPFVYAYLEHTGAHKRVHQQMENDWDVRFLRDLRGESAYGYAFPFDPKKIAREGTLFPFIREAAEKLGRRPVPAGAFKRGLRLFGWYLHHFHKRRGRFLLPFGCSRLYVREPEEEDFFGGELFRSLNKSGAKDARDLFDAAVEKSAKRIEEFIAALENGTPLPREPFSKHLLTGVPALSDPLP